MSFPFSSLFFSVFSSSSVLFCFPVFPWNGRWARLLFVWVDIWSLRRGGGRLGAGILWLRKNVLEVGPFRNTRIYDQIIGDIIVLECGRFSGHLFLCSRDARWFFQLSGQPISGYPRFSQELLVLCPENLAQLVHLMCLPLYFLEKYGPDFLGNMA